MYIYWSAGIRIYAFKGEQIGLGEMLHNPERQEFVSLVTKHLLALKSLKTGRKLIDAINNSGKMCTIFKAGLKQTGWQKGQETTNVTMADPPGVLSEYQAQVKHFAPLHQLLPTNLKGNVDNSSAPIVNKMSTMNAKDLLKKPLGPIQFGGRTEQVRAYKQELFENRLPIARYQVAANLTRAIERSKKFRLTIAKRAGISLGDLRAMEAGEKKIDQETYYRLAFMLYDYLEPGSGVNSQVRLQAVDRLGEGEKYNPTVNYDHVPGHIIVGHELVHAWRMMVGRRLVRQGWEEEAMTVGMFQFTDLEFNENKLRSDAGLPKRPTYESGICSSLFMHNTMYQTNRFGTSFKEN